MAASQAVLAAGTLLEYNNGSSWVEAIEATSLGNVGDVGTFVEVTSLNSPNSTKEYKPAMKDTEDKSFTMRYVPGDTDQAALLTRAQNQTQTQFRVTFPTTPSQTATFTVELSSYQVEDPQHDAPLNVIVHGKQSGTTTWS